MALLFRNSTKQLACFLTVGQVSLLTLYGVMSGYSMIYFIFGVSSVAAAMSCFIYAVDLQDPKSCGAWFQRQFWTVGGVLLANMSCEYLIKVGNIGR